MASRVLRPIASMVTAPLAVGLVLVTAVAPLGCARTRPATTAPTDSATPLSRAMLGSGSTLATGDAFDRLLDSPEVAAAGEHLLDRLGNDPALTPRYAELLASVLGQPALRQTFVEVAAKSPDASIDALSELIVGRFVEGLDGPEFDAAMDVSLRRLLDRPMVDEAFGRMADVILERGRILERLAVLLEGWSPELEVALGVPVGDERFEERFEAHLADPGRSEALEALLGDRIADDPEIRGLLAALLQDPSFFAACAGLIDDILDSPALDERTTAVVIGVIEHQDRAELEARLDALLVTPELEAAVTRWADRVADNEAYGVLCERLGAVLDEPNLQAELFAVLIGAAGGPSA